MFDSRLRPLIDPPLQRAGRALAARGVSADVLTGIGCAAGLAAAAAIVAGAFTLALVLFLAGRGIDGLDGAVARATTKTDRGGFLDIVFDFAVYAAIPLAFALNDPANNAVSAAILLAAIVLNGSAFLTYALMAERRGLTTQAHGDKSLYFVAGLAEGAETIVVYAVFCLWPGAFPHLATAFAALCLISGLARIAMAWRALR